MADGLLLQRIKLIERNRNPFSYIHSFQDMNYCKLVCIYDNIFAISSYD
jgi:hypothetical protein